MNIILLFSELVLTLSTLIVLYHKYKKEGIYAWIVLATILSNIMITKTINISGLDINLGIIIIATIFIATNLLIQKEGEKETNKIILTIFLTSLLTNFLLILVSFLDISSLTTSMDNAYNKLVINNILLITINNIILLITLKINSYLYYKVKIIENKIWVSNIISMMVSELIYGILLGAMYLSYYHTFFDTTIITIIRFLFAILTQSLGTIIIYYFNNQKS